MTVKRNQSKRVVTKADAKVGSHVELCELSRALDDICRVMKEFEEVLNDTAENDLTKMDYARHVMLPILQGSVKVACHMAHSPLIAHCPYVAHHLPTFLSLLTYNHIK